MADGPHKHYLSTGGGGSGGLFSDLQAMSGVFRARRAKIFTYGFLFAFVAFTAFLAFNPSAAPSSPWFDRFFSSSSSSSSSTSTYPSQFSSFFSQIFPSSPPAHPSVSPPSVTVSSVPGSVSNATQPSSPVGGVSNRTADKVVVTGSRVSNFTASLARKNATIGASTKAENDTKQVAPDTSTKNKTATVPVPVPVPEKAKNGTKPENLDKKPLNSTKNQTFVVNQNKSKTVALNRKNETFAGNSTTTKVPEKPTREISLESLKKCDLFDGKWVKDDSYPLYKEGSCPHIDEPFDCFLNGRPDRDYQKLRWQPRGCNIPRLNGMDMLERLRGRRLVFVGDSLNRNMWESLVCVLRNSVEDKNKVFEASGRREFRTEGSYSFVFKDYNCSVEFFRSPFLVQEWETPENGSTKETLRLDLIERKSDRYKKADIIVFNTGHWWTHEKTSLGKDYYQEGSHIYGQLNVVEAFRKALVTWAKWVDTNVDAHKTLVFFRGYSASHFRGGRWNSGGACDEETQPITNDTYLAKYPAKMRVLETVLKGMNTPISYLNITRMTDYRKDAHPSVYRKRHLTSEERNSPLRYQDCSHWCLPGVPDSWNELLYAELLIKL